MGRTPIEINHAALQGIMNGEIAPAYANHLTMMGFYGVCATKYNERRITPKLIHDHTINNRVNKGELICDYKPAIGKRVLTPTHLHNMQVGRITTRRSKVITNQAHIDALRVSLPSFPTVVDKVIKGNKISQIKAKCLDCVNAECNTGYIDIIRNCPSLDCGIWNNRPYQRRKNTNE